MLNRLEHRDLYLLLLIRRFEQELLRLFSNGLIDGTTHTCLGQEYVPVALSALLGPDDYVFSNHRGHGHYLARFDDPASLLAEIMGRAGAVCGGVGGSQHIHRGTYFSSGVQGESLPVALGAALHLKRHGGGSLALAYIGDGTFGQGTVYEALNMAALWGAPLVVVVENNHIAQTTPIDRHLSGTIAGRAAAFGLAFHRITTCDVPAIRAGLEPLVRRVRGREEPLVVEFDTVRLGPHSKGDDPRGDDELARLRSRDWCTRYEEDYPDQFGEADAEACAAVDAVVADVLTRSPAPGGAV
ncbi:MAG TPA: thiamine pyrophosphate-dependent dehydrogenase E1 component subunit alpha [Streptosporangiaceae bacterium]|nr:thiamine pyrophosphate-dependent dehydrogenase E1 component subunit alpha [Streptosporangiaceae bacterium]